MNNLERAEKARVAYDASSYSAEDTIPNLYDLICDLLHLADLYEDPQSAVVPHTETNGEFVARMGLWHYREEVREEAEDMAASQS